MEEGNSESTENESEDKSEHANRKMREVRDQHYNLKQNYGGKTRLKASRKRANGDSNSYDSDERNIHNNHRKSQELYRRNDKGCAYQPTGGSTSCPPRRVCLQTIN
jgi:hypothetical protein